jgi:hypothetical protein
MKNSRHKWYTLSGLISRLISTLAIRWAESPNELFPVAVFAYGIVELFGVRRAAKILVKFQRFHAKKAKKFRSPVGVSDASTSATRTDSNGPLS